MEPVSKNDNGNPFIGHCLDDETRTKAMATMYQKSMIAAEDNDDSIVDIPAAMSASYSEISFDGTPVTAVAPTIPATSTTTIVQRPATLIYGRGKPSFPYNLGGTVSIDGNITNYVTENLEYKIKLASPNTMVNTKIEASSGGGSMSNSRTSTPSTSLLPPSQRLQFPQSVTQQLSNTQSASSATAGYVDLNVLNDVEIEAQYLAASVDNLTENLCNLLHSISSITADNVETYKNAVNKLTDGMDGNIKNMYTIMAKTEEISNAMKPSEQLANRIREIRHLLDMLDNIL